MRKTVLLLAVLLGILVTIGCGKDEPVDGQEASIPIPMPPALDESTTDDAAGGADLPSASASDGALSQNPNAR